MPRRAERATGILAHVLAALFLVACDGPREAPDPLPSWRDGPTKGAVVGFVGRVTTRGSPDLLPPEERVAVFDNDGTLWSEQPLYFQLQLALDRVEELAPAHPAWRTEEPFRSVLEGDVQRALGGGARSVAAIVEATQAGMTEDEYAEVVRAWADTARHPRFGRRYRDLVYQPMLELLRYLRAKGFTTWIVSGGDVAFMRPWAEETYGVPRAQIIGSTAGLRLDARDGGAALVRLPSMDFVDDGPGKVLAIDRIIGRRPVIAFGNSDGDLEMLEWTTDGPGPRFAAIVHHTDATREWAYDRASHVGRLSRALDLAAERGWTRVDMRQDWRVIYPFELGATAPPE